MSIIPKDKNEFIAFFKENIALLLLGLYTLSFVNYYLYYKSFEISIFNYVGINDLLFFSLEYIFKIILLIFISEVILFIIYAVFFGIYEKFIIFIIKKKGMLYLSSKKENKERIKKLFEKKFSNSLKVFKITIVFLSMFTIPFFSYKLILYPTILVYMIYHLERISQEKLTYLMLSASSIIIIFFSIITTLVNAYNKRFEKDDYIISFNEDKNFISTDTKISCYNYLGETSSNIFLYDIENKESKIYFKDKISDLKIKNSVNIDNSIIKIKNNFIIKSFIEMLNE
jgi:hypothetical protein